MSKKMKKESERVKNKIKKEIIVKSKVLYIVKESGIRE